MYFCKLISKKYMDTLFQDKTHDESRQGEALMLEPNDKNNGRKLYIESYGCAMNFSDSELVASILTESGFETTSDYAVADVVLINTCSIRENAEQRCHLVQGALAGRAGSYRHHHRCAHARR